ncbi:MAG TPA: sugar phosphate nucleotidyltransferase, partial [Candidatus Latescibacteria bacterium]|nr:sugar phosphate nucleotidyltransferase [Candidatus Latescibacterota bacterium]
ENAPCVVVVGFVPLRPDTGLGYIRFGHETREIEGIQFYRVDEFVEKPNKARAIQYVEDGRYLWNSGMFVMQARHALNLFSRFLPRHFALLEEIKSSLGTPDEPAVTENAYQRFDRVSLDVGIMEKADNVEVIRADFGWLDIGTWAALDQISLHDARGNVVRGQHVGLDTERCIIRTSNSVVATMGVHDLVIIETDAAVLVCPKSRVQEVKNLVEALEREGREDVT